MNGVKTVTDKLQIAPAKQKALKGQTVLIKYGGNAMLKEDLRQAVAGDVKALLEKEVVPVLVHGGGPAIKAMLDEAGIVSEFVDGHRKTDEKSMRYVEMALKGQVNGELVNMFNRQGIPAVGLSGKDGAMVTAVERIHRKETWEGVEEVPLGHVGDVQKINPALVHTLTRHGYVPVIAPIGVGRDGKDYNINADMFAGHMAGALRAAAYVALTDVDGLQRDKDDPDTRVAKLSADEARKAFGHVIQGGMIPKVESALIALEQGVQHAHIINGMKKHTILQQLLTASPCGTQIQK